MRDTSPTARQARITLDEISTLPAEVFGPPLPRDPRIRRAAQALINDPSDARDIGK
ncbi:hypothetical protein [Acetobacter fallax]|uniref:Uncharacterized protein n=1 Tax=Acetobacter fallax TaxID=1737473 RepID=A0ABX0K705_9PROT|nr:hypothetical protein [Acetobacter fallax]NHO32184.1 hypothetical protein [Acetobacter fallax]NHO35763.1 hypothetical protein [Acetobacter fallax]